MNDEFISLVVLCLLLPSLVCFFFLINFYMHVRILYNAAREYCSDSNLKRSRIHPQTHSILLCDVKTDEISTQEINELCHAIILI